MKTITAVIALAVMLVACGEKTEQVAQPVKQEVVSEDLKNCIEKDPNPFLVELRKQASDNVNVSAKYALRATCQQMIGEPVDAMDSQTLRQANIANMQVAAKAIQNMETK